MRSARRLQRHDVQGVVARVVAKLSREATINHYVNPLISSTQLSEALHATRDASWVAVDDDQIVGHLYGALLENDDYGRGIWIGPDGCSFDDIDILAELYAQAGSHWISEGARDHYVWTLDEPSSTQPWLELGFARMHQRGVIALDRDFSHELRDGYSIRIGGAHEIDLAVELDHQLDEFQKLGPSFSMGANRSSRRADLLDTLEDPEVHHYIVEWAHEGVAQCLTFPLPDIRGSFPRTLHLSAVTVATAHRERGIATAMVDRALSDARTQGFDFCETNWRVTNRRASSHWRHYGFTPTYVRLHRTIASS
ncbi:MAG: GNAT family N-acetyltransferase [Acidimicrobiaceae bacterium]|nr:GNAT family N-acetyltransferase [Acidimicrobiaceae bacterium]